MWGVRAESGTAAEMQEVEQRMEHDYMDVGVRVVPGATTELSREPEPRRQIRGKVIESAVSTKYIRKN